MAYFTHPLIIKPVKTPTKGWAKLMPPGMARPIWAVVNGFHYITKNGTMLQECISVPDEFCFDGASVPLFFWRIFPMVHPSYIQAAALHDWMIASKLYSRKRCDFVFYEALGVLGISQPWRWMMYIAVRIGSLMNYFLK